MENRKNKAKTKIKKTTTKKYINNYIFPNGDIFSRMNYLFQISESVYLNPQTHNINEQNQTGKAFVKSQNNILSRLYISIMKDISKRNVIRISKQVKKMICQQCNNLLYKDTNSELKFINKDGQNCLQITCGYCNHISKIIYL